MILLAFFQLQGKAQDVQYSQFYAAPLYLNPAFAGSTELTRVGVNYRNQWPGLDHSFNAYSAYIDHYIMDYNSGVGLIVNGSRESLANISNMEVGLIYSYRLQLSDNQFLRFGGQLSYVTRDAAFEELVFGNQIDIDRGQIVGSTPILPGLDSRQRFFDVHFGMLWNSEKFWLGASGHHLTSPQIAFFDDEANNLATKYSVHGGVKWDLLSGKINDFFNNTQQHRQLALAFNYKQQDPFNQLDIGTQLFLEPLILGLWYRGLPTKNNLPNSESVIALVGFSLPDGLDIGYSFDFTTSKLGLRNSGGAHEISLRYSFFYGDPSQRNRKRSILPCFKF